MPSIVDIDPEDPAQALDESGDFHVEPLAVDAEPSAEAADELDQAAAEAYAEDHTREEELPPEHREGTGELYGVHVPRAQDRELAAPEDHDSFQDSELGETWLEALETRATEGGATPEHEVVIVDDSDPHERHSPSDFRDRPKADRGSGGTGGL